MDRIVVPNFCSWFKQSAMITTPDNGLLYHSKIDVTYIGPLLKNEAPVIKLTNIRSLILALACDPDWSETRQFATFDELHNVNVWCLDKGVAIKGHRGHYFKNDVPNIPRARQQNLTAAICYTLTKKILSVDHSTLIVYCLLSNKYKVFNDFFKKNGTVVILKPSPYDKYIFAAGTNNGLITIFSIESNTILHTIRAHDKEIVSLEWMLVDAIVTENAIALMPGTTKTINRKNKKKKIEPAFDASDIFDIYSYDNNEYEFGTITDLKTTTYKDDQDGSFKETTNTENFNFVEACQNLKNDILGNPNDDEEAGPNDDSIFNTTASANVEEFGVNINTQSENVDTEIVFATPTSTPSENENYLDECERLKDFIVVSKEDDSPQSESDEKDEMITKILLASGSRENVIWIWDTETGVAVDKIMLQSHKSSTSRTSIFTNVIWLNMKKLIANDPAGNVCEWTLNFSSNDNHLRVVTEKTQTRYPLENVIQLCKSLPSVDAEDSSASHLWATLFPHKLVCMRLEEPYEFMANFELFPSNNSCMAENTLDSNILAIGCVDKKIVTLNLSNIDAKNVQTKSYVNKVQARVMCLDWHPEKENILAFGTTEGRIGIFDTNNTNNVPTLLKPFCCQDVYSVKWCFLTDERGLTNWTLFCTSRNKCVYYPIIGQHKYEPIEMKRFGNSSCIFVYENLLFIGTQDGFLNISNLRENMKKLYMKPIVKRYICGMDYKNKMLAVSSKDANIKLIDLEQMNDADDDNIRELVGHTESVCTVRWGRGDNNKLVSASFDSTVRVWDTTNLTCISVFASVDAVFSAIFSPINENMVIIIGKSITFNCYDYTKHENDIPKLAKKKLKNNHFKLGTIEDRDIIKSRSEKKRSPQPKIEKSLPEMVDDHYTAVVLPNTEIQDAEIDLLAENMKECQLKVKSKPDKSTQLATNVQTVLLLTNKEINRPGNTLRCIIQMLDPSSILTNKDESEEESGEQATTHQEFLNVKLFSDRETVKELLELEMKNHKQSKTTSIAHLMLPQINGSLKDEILERIASKTLTEQFVSLSPAISFVFWKQCCEAYAYQCLHNEEPLAAIPYLLACHKIDESLEYLCKHKFFREAIIICKLRKEEGDPIHDKIASDWALHLELCGNMEGAAQIWTSMKSYKNAVAVLSKRKVITEEIQDAIDHLNKKLAILNVV